MKVAFNSGIPTIISAEFFYFLFFKIFNFQIIHLSFIFLLIILLELYCTGCVTMQGSKIDQKFFSKFCKMDDYIGWELIYKLT